MKKSNNQPMEFEKIQGRLYPVVRCKLNRYGQWFFYCPYCKKNHNHGPVEGHRSPHCSNDKSPYYKSGYIIKLEQEPPQSHLEV